MSKWNTLLLTGVVAACISTVYAADKAPTAEKAPAVLEHKVKNIAGQEVDLSKYKGKVLLVVNVASRCGLTDQYEQLQGLHDKYSDKGLAVMGFPCNQFGKQEPGSEADIAAFCTKDYGVKFDMFSKLNVNTIKKDGKVIEEADPFYQSLTSTETKPAGKGNITWNFEKFVIGRNGEVVARFAPRTSPDDAEVVKVIEAELAKK
ncbi:Hydroperoxy fatty acid reductase gpx1 [Anatilimnocola aggregata]|uniref:Glutathione peroxidase n=1 Tax=Anatilimnocola aggregata TaxID=2528021 RepID=A0A517YHI9_9BACT|nr:glutathione peroxidase [Anatilimnocola aggregata]QDU29684.1 Hydroperoxy fatty acid reductase gpx1 [Anatilimnocola aggregata]